VKGVLQRGADISLTASALVAYCKGSAEEQQQVKTEPLTQVERQQQRGCRQTPAPVTKSVFVLLFCAAP
jgi:hypothetical protein